MSSHFDQAMKSFIDLSKSILKFNTDANYFATKKEKKKHVKNPILKCLENYSADYTLSDEEGNKDDVMVTYRKIKAALLKGWKVDDWLKASNIVIYSGAIEPDDKRKIMLSALYNLACRHRDHSKESLNGLPIEVYDGREELLYPAKFQLYMYRVFLFALSGEEYGEDITALNNIVSELEKELKIQPSTKKPGEEVKSDNPIMDGFFGMAKDILSKMGVSIPEGTQLPAGGSEIMGAATSLFGRPEVKDLMSDIGESMKSARDPGDAIQKALAKFQEPNSLNKIKKLASNLIPPEAMASLNGMSTPNNSQLSLESTKE